MNVSEMRRELMEAYPWPSMRRKLERMTDAQIERAYTTIRKPERFRPVVRKPQQLSFFN